MSTSSSTPPSRYPLATSSWGREEIAAIQAVLESGRFTMGPRVAEFERAFAAQVGARHAVMVNSGSSANLLMVAALFFRRHEPLQRGDEVVVPAVSWPTTYYPLGQYGLRLRFVDIDAATLNVDLDGLRAAITPETRAILAVNLLGNPNDFAAIRQIIGRRDIILLEDNCESLGAQVGGRQAGTFGLMGTFSLFFSHHISAMEGGVVVTDDDELHQILLSLRAHGWTRDLPEQNLVTGTKSADPFEESFRFVLPGYNVRPLEIEAAAALEQVKKLPRFLAARRENARLFVDLFANHPYLQIQQEIGSSSWFGFSLLIRDGAGLDRRDLVKRLTESGIESRPIVAGNFAKNPVMRWLDHAPLPPLPNAERVDSAGLFVGNQERPLGDELTLLRGVLD